MKDNMLGPSPMNIKYVSYVYDGFCIWRTDFPGPIESVISKFTCIIIFIIIIIITIIIIIIIIFINIIIIIIIIIVGSDTCAEYRVSSEGSAEEQD